MAYDAILFSILTAFILRMGFIYMMNYCAGTIACMCIFIVQVSLFAASYGFYSLRLWEIMNGKPIKELMNDEAKDKEIDATLKETAESWEERAKMELILSIAFFILGLIFMCCVLCNYNDAKVAIQVVSLSSEFLFANPVTILIPILSSIVSIVVVLLWALCLAGILSMGDVKP